MYVCMYPGFGQLLGGQAIDSHSDAAAADCPDLGVQRERRHQAQAPRSQDCGSISSEYSTHTYIY